MKKLFLKFLANPIPVCLCLLGLILLTALLNIILKCEVWWAYVYDIIAYIIMAFLGLLVVSYIIVAIYNLFNKKQQ